MTPTQAIETIKAAREALRLLLDAVEMDIALFPDQPHKDSCVGKSREALASLPEAISELEDHFREVTEMVDEKNYG